MEMVERVAKAIAEGCGETWDWADPETQAEIRDHYLHTARAVIAAMREPTKEMVVAGDDEKENCVDSDWDSDSDGNRSYYTTISSDLPARVFRAMIGAALAENAA